MNLKIYFVLLFFQFFIKKKKEREKRKEIVGDSTKTARRSGSNLHQESVRYRQSRWWNYYYLKNQFFHFSIFFFSDAKLGNNCHPLSATHFLLPFSPHNISISIFFPINKSDTYYQFFFFSLSLSNINY